MWTWWVVAAAQNWKIKTILLFALWKLYLILLFQVAMVETAADRKLWKKFWKMFCVFVLNLLFLLFSLNTVWKFVIALVSLLFIAFIACGLRQFLSRLVLVCQLHSLMILWKLSTCHINIDYGLMIRLIGWLICKWISSMV